MSFEKKPSIRGVAKIVITKNVFAQPMGLTDLSVLFCLWLWFSSYQIPFPISLKKIKINWLTIFFLLLSQSLPTQMTLLSCTHAWPDLPKGGLISESFSPQKKKMGPNHCPEYFLFKWTVIWALASFIWRFEPRLKTFWD